MAIPGIQELYNPILGYLSEFGEDTLASIRKAMQKYFYISEEDAFINKMLHSHYTLFECRVNAACYNLYHANLLERPRKGVYAISESGYNVAYSDEDVDSDYLRNIKSFREYSKKKRKFEDKYKYKYEDEYFDKYAYQDSNFKKEYIEIEEVTLTHIIELKQQDARFANMLATGLYMLENSQITSVPIEVLQHKMTLGEYRDTTPSHSVSNIAFACKTTTYLSIKNELKQKRKAIPGGVGSKPRKWENPDPFVTKAINDDYSKLKHYKNIKKIKEAMKELILNDYKISYAELHRKTGISEDKLRNMCTDDTYNPKFLDLIAILIKLKVPIVVCEYILSLAGFPPSADKYGQHFEVIEMARYYSAPEINDLCDKIGIDRIFPATILD